MNPGNHIANLFLKQARNTFDKYLPHIVRCLELMSDEEIWWRPNAKSNSAGNLVLHLTGNVRQWIISGLGGVPDTRLRDKEFSEQGPIPRRVLISKLRAAVKEADRVLEGLSPDALARTYSIQGYRVTGLAAVSGVSEHFSHHAGQIIFNAKMQRGQDLRFTKLPAYRRGKEAHKMPLASPGAHPSRRKNQ